MGPASGEQVMKMLLATFKVQGNCFLLKHSESSRQKLRGQGARLLLRGLGAVTLLFSPWKFDDSGWSALAQSPGLTGNPPFFKVTESLSYNHYL